MNTEPETQPAGPRRFRAIIVQSKYFHADFTLWDCGLMTERQFIGRLKTAATAFGRKKVFGMELNADAQRAMLKAQAVVQQAGYEKIKAKKKAKKK
jgi:hypothetical protein